MLMNNINSKKENFIKIWKNSERQFFTVTHKTTLNVNSGQVTVLKFLYYEKQTQDVSPTNS